MANDLNLGELKITLETLDDALVGFKTESESEMMCACMRARQPPQAQAHRTLIGAMLGHGDEARLVDGLFSQTGFGYGLQD